MRIDPVEEWRRLTEHYRQMSDVQLEELALDFADLTEMAQQVLRGELRHRGLDQPDSAHRDRQTAKRVPVGRQVPLAERAENADSPDGTDSEGADGEEPHQYTWKTLLCECSEREQAWQISEMLRRAGIESWIEGPGTYSPYADLDMTSPRILVAADELDEARQVAARPIPQDIIDESRETPDDFEPPACPSCRAQDPVLESVEPVNTWRCESCGREWTDPVPSEGGEVKRLEW